MLGADALLGRRAAASLHLVLPATCVPQLR
jgi:hypothetical protein